MPSGSVTWAVRVCALPALAPLLVLHSTALVLPSRVNIGAIFTEDQHDSPVDLAFKYAVLNVNEDSLSLPNTTLEYDIQYVYKEDSFHAAKKVCSQLQAGVVGVFGPSDPLLGGHVQSICDTVHVPHVETRLDVDPVPRAYSVNLHPSYSDLTRAYKDLMAFLNWTRIAVVYEEDAGLIKLQDLMRAPPDLEMEAYIRQATPSNFRDVLKEIKNKDIFNLVVDTNPENINQFLRALLQLQMNDERYHYLFTSFDTETFDLEDFRYNGVNMTGFRLVDADSGWVRNSIAELRKFQPVGAALVHPHGVIKTETALVLDSVRAFVHGLHALSAARAPFHTPNTSCDALHVWSGGEAFYKHVSAVEMPGLTGPVKFSGGRRTGLRLDLMKLQPSGMRKVGSWTSEHGVNVTDMSAFYGTGIPNITLLVSTIQELPFIMKRTNETSGEQWFDGFCIDLLNRISAICGFRYEIYQEPQNRYGVYNAATDQWDGLVKTVMDQERPFIIHRPAAANASRGESFEGFCVDLLERVAELVGFRYRIELAPEGIFGYPDKSTGEWNGLVRRLMDKKADLAVASMTINYAREGVIDFTKPFMNLGISILFKVPNSQPTRLFSFMNPLAVEIWLYVMAAYVIVSFTMFVMARFSPYEWNNPHPCFADNDVVENQFSVSNSFWFITGTLLRQGSGLNPKAASTRIVGSIWWFFTLIIISSYTANLAAFLTVERTSTPIESADDLAKQTDIEYGTLEGGSTMTFFRDSKIDTYQTMWEFMEGRKPSVFVSNYEEGVQRVLDGNYAFLMESTMLDYIVQRNCNLTQVGGLLDSKGYGIATPIGSPWRDKISLAILDLQEKGVIQMLYNKWWKDTGDVCSRDEKKKDSKARSLGIANIGGVFVVLLCGLSLAIIVAMLEFCWNSKKNAQTDRQKAVGGASRRSRTDSDLSSQSLCSEMASELRFAMRCHAPPRRPALRRSCSRCQNSSATYVPPPPRAPSNGCDIMAGARFIENGASCQRGSFGYEVNDLS